MDAHEVRAAWERAARRVAGDEGGPDGAWAPESDDVPTFAGTPAAACAEHLEGAAAVVLGIPHADGGQSYTDDVGLSGRELVRALRTLATGRIAGFDICCLEPRCDRRGQVARLAARATAEIVAGLAAQRP